MTKRIGRPLLTAVFALALFAAAATPEVEAASIEFTVAPIINAGSVSFAGGSAPLVGTDIRISQITGIDTPLNAGVTLTCTACELTFETGAYLGNIGPFSLWDSAGSSVSVTGGVNLVAGLPFEIPLGSTLLSGGFSTAILDTHLGGLNLTAAMIEHSYHSALAAFFGIDDGPAISDFLLNFVAEGSLPESMASTSILSGSIVTSVPETDTWWLVGLSASLALVGRRVVRARHAERPE